MSAKILVIEDDLTISEGMRDVLDIEGFQVVTAPDGVEGIHRAKTTQPDLIICDIMMPRLNGYGVLKQLRAMPDMLLVPFIFLTAKATREDIRAGMDLGADDYLTKPFDPEELLEMVNTRLHLQAAREKEYTQQLDSLRVSVSRSLPHELRTPLTSILGYVELMIEDFDNLDREKTFSMLLAVQRAGLRLNDFIEKYMLYAQLETLRHPDEQVQGFGDARTDNVNTMMRDAALAKARIYERANDLYHDLEKATLAIYFDDLLKIVNELTDNALKFSETGMPVQIVGRVNGDMYRLWFINQGRGMTAEEIRQVGAYTQFNRVIHEQQGMGLGLTIARRLSEIYGGGLTIKSKPDDETRVRVELPIFQS